MCLFNVMICWREGSEYKMFKCELGISFRMYLGVVVGYGVVRMEWSTAVAKNWMPSTMKGDQTPLFCCLNTGCLWLLRSCLGWSAYTVYK